MITASWSRARGSRMTSGTATPYLLLLPFALLLGVFVVWPVVYSMAISLTDWRLGFLDRSFVGFANYLEVVTSPRTQTALLNTALFAVATVLLGGGLGLLLALALQSLRRHRRWFQLAYTIPVMATAAAMALVWRLFFDTHFGVLNQFLSSLGIAAQPWLQEPLTARAAVLMVETWRITGYALLLFSAGLASIPRDVRHAAQVDGVGPGGLFRHITWPLLAPTTLFVMVVLTARSFQSFDTVRVLTNGGPQRATQLLPHVLFEEAFTFFNTGTASALAVLMALVTFGVGYGQFRIEKRVYYR